jgi:cytochrome oxidase Cu insertion factor (SCO1/SenC/PrrC family)
MRLAREERIALGTLALLGVVTAAWWALALWPVPGETPSWLARVRTVCFGATDSGLPDISGWLLLIGQPLGMLGLLMVGWGRVVRSGLVHLVGHTPGKVAAALVVVLVAAGTGAAGMRVATAMAPVAFEIPNDVTPSPDYPRLDRTPPPHALVDQDGREVSAADLAGKPAFVTFAFGHCTTLCPVVVQQVLAARDLLAEGNEELPTVAVVTLDPWRDTPSRLPHLARQWDLPDDALVLSGEVDQVNAALDAWGVARERDPRTGDIAHPALVFILDAEGSVRYASSGGPRALAELARRVSPTSSE